MRGPAKIGFHATRWCVRRCEVCHRNDPGHPAKAGLDDRQTQWVEAIALASLVSED